MRAPLPSLRRYDELVAQAEREEWKADDPRTRSLTEAWRTASCAARIWVCLRDGHVGAAIGQLPWPARWRGGGTAELIYQTDMLVGGIGDLFTEAELLRDVAEAIRDDEGPAERHRELIDELRGIRGSLDRLGRGVSR